MNFLHFRKMGNRLICKRFIVISLIVFTFSAITYAQYSPAFEAKYKISDYANLRILVNNIWEYSQDTIPPMWQEIGEDPRDHVRAPQFVKLITEHMPDVFGLQEYSTHMHKEFYQSIMSKGYEIVWESQEDWNNTPIFYYSGTTEPLYVNYHKFSPEQWCNRGTKSYTSAVFKRKSDNKIYALINTHLWWKGDSVQPGSTMARAAQIWLIMAEAEIIKAEYGEIPIFITGDMNCEENTVPIQQLILNGYTPCYKAAKDYGDKNNGHHICSPKDGFSTQSRRKGPDRESGAIDHCLFIDPKNTIEIRVFDCIMEEYIVKLTDHYPLLIDINL